MYERPRNRQPLDVWIGIDSGSTTSKFVFLDGQSTPVYSYYSNNRGAPLKVLSAALIEAREHARARGTELNVLGVGTTGYGEELSAAAFHADYHTVETVAHARAARLVEPGAEPLVAAGEFFDPNVVKVVTDRNGFAPYFSRAPIPWDRDAFALSTDELPAGAQHYRHIGLYAYRADYLQQYVDAPHCELERMESLEQLRVLWQGDRIYVGEAEALPGHGVDTEADLVRAEAALIELEQIQG